MKTLVTGGAGFIGSTLVDRLVAEDHDVTIIDNLVAGKLSNLEDAVGAGKADFHEMDIRAPEVADLVASIRPEVVFHLAAQIDVRVSVEDPVYDADVNVIGALRVLEGARKAGTRRVVFASSGGTIYGSVPDDKLPVDESVTQAPLAPYGITKRAFGDYLRAYTELHGIEHVSLALANVFGPRQDPHGEAGVVAIFSKRILAGEQCKIFGDGKATRDYVYVDDVVDAFVRSATKGDGLYNIGTGVETSTYELYETLARAANVTVEPEYAPARNGELQRSSLDSSKARSELSWSPMTNIQDGSAKVLEYFSRQA